MSLFIFHCPNCGNEIPQTSVEEDRVCRRCSTIMEARVYPPTFIFKGSGWPSKDIKEDRWERENERLSEEPISDSEMSEIPDLLKAEGKRLRGDEKAYLQKTTIQAEKEYGIKDIKNPTEEEKKKLKEKGAEKAKKQKNLIEKGRRRK